MGFAEAIRTLNVLRHRRIIPDYALIGAVAATAYMEPIFTEDLHIIVLVDTDEEYLRVFRRVAQLAEGLKGMHYTLNGVPVQMFPSTTKPLYRDPVQQARSARIGNLRVKVASPEHLILLCLEAFRDKDRLRISSLLRTADNDRLRELLVRSDDEDGILAERLQTLL